MQWYFLSHLGWACLNYPIEEDKGWTGLWGGTIHPRDAEYFEKDKVPISFLVRALLFDWGLNNVALLEISISSKNSCITQFKREGRRRGKNPPPN